jgi:low temperature requirement protein LtrA
MAAETGAVPIIRGSEARVGFAELFFDLIFVFAITQVSHALLYHYDLKGAAETALLLLAVWWVWIYSTWALNRLNPDHVAVRGLLFGLMAAGLFLSMAIPDAFGERGWVFGLAFAAMQVGRTVFIWVALGHAIAGYLYAHPDLGQRGRGALGDWRSCAARMALHALVARAGGGNRGSGPRLSLARTGP